LPVLRSGDRAESQTHGFRKSELSTAPLKDGNRFQNLTHDFREVSELGDLVISEDL
jgi:hypothetical protein